MTNFSYGKQKCRIVEEKEFWINQTLERRYPEQASANHQETGCRGVEMQDGFELGIEARLKWTWSKT